ncbi:MAG: hypothetical protein JXB38_07460 [Anaerolineales bacterium]|nr:hypothetical protein [Anaerolineales bacterium]
MNKETLRPYLKRFLIMLGISILLVFAISEVAFRIQVRQGDPDRAPQTIELTIPAGTAAAIEQGEPVLTLPDEMVFVLGDVLLVQNNDNVAHELGPMLVPPNTSASMPMDQADNLSLSCSFQPSNYLGVEIKEPTTLFTRFIGIAFAVPATLVMLFGYSLLAYPVNKPEDGPTPAGAGD